MNIAMKIYRKELCIHRHCQNFVSGDTPPLSTAPAWSRGGESIEDDHLQNFKTTQTYEK